MGGGDTSILDLIATLRCLLDSVDYIQSWTPAYKASALYVATCARNRGIVNGILYLLGEGG